MSFDAVGQLNWLAVIVGTLIYFALGALWVRAPVPGASMAALDRLGS